MKRGERSRSFNFMQEQLDLCEMKIYTPYQKRELEIANQLQGMSLDADANPAGLLLPVRSEEKRQFLHAVGYMMSPSLQVLPSSCNDGATLPPT